MSDKTLANSYVPTWEGWLYLVGVKDLYACEMVDQTMDIWMTTDLVSIVRMPTKPG